MPRGEELFSGFALLPRLFFCREEEEMLGIYCVCFYRKDRTIIFCLLASGSKSFGFDCICRAVVREFFSRLKSFVASSASWRCCLRVAAKKKVLLSLLCFGYFQGKEAVTQCVLGQGFEVYKCNPTSLHTKPTWDHPPVNTSDCVRNNFLQWQQDVSVMHERSEG